MSKFHSVFLEKIRKNVGASFLSYVRRGDNYFLRAIKDSKEHEFSLVGTPQDVSFERYNELNKELQEYFS